MTIITYAREPGLSKSWLVLLLAAIAVVAIVTALPRHITIAAIKPIPPVVYEKHAVNRHSVDAIAVRQCLQNNGGATEIWRSFDHKRFYLLCQLPDGRWGFQEIEKALDGKWHEVTAYVRDNPTITALKKYLEGWATKFNGPYPW